jgi:glycogen operon protein
MSMTGDHAKTNDWMGKSFPLGATVYSDGVNFSIFSKNATAIDLLLFDAVDDARPARVISLDQRSNRTFHFWHVYVADIKLGQLYAYRAHGPFDPDKGYRFDPDKVLLDPYGKGVAVPAQKNPHWEIIREAMKSVANLAIFPVQDILGIDRKFIHHGIVKAF